ncbi:MAG: AraC family transcriptional regulator ligand-binding domain-containing protein [Novosphingobium sp.]
MKSDSLLAALPDLSARIMRDALADQLNIRWDRFCQDSRVKTLTLDDAMSELLAEEELQLQQGFVRTTESHPNLWLDVGLRYRAIKYGTLGLAMMTSRTLGEALQVACRYQALTFSLINYRYAAAPNGSCVLLGEDHELPDNLREFTQHRDLGAIRTLFYDLMAGERVLERITVAAPPPANWSVMRRHFDCPVEFNAPQTQWHCLPGSVQRPLPLGDGELTSLYSGHCDGLLSRAHADAPVTHRLTLLMNRNSDSLPSATEAAKRLALSERTLHRRLAEEGTRFSTLVDEMRYSRARELLADRQMTIETIAFALGFAEPSSFSRAFKRWSGMAAAEYRQSLLR